MEMLKKLGIEDWINEKKASGAIRQVGFSYHGNADMSLFLFTFCEHFIISFSCLFIKGKIDGCVVIIISPDSVVETSLSPLQ